MPYTSSNTLMVPITMSFSPNKLFTFCGLNNFISMPNGVTRTGRSVYFFVSSAITSLVDNSRSAILRLYFKTALCKKLFLGGAGGARPRGGGGGGGGGGGAPGN